MKVSKRPVGERIIMRALAYLTPQDLELLRQRMPRLSRVIDAELRVRSGIRRQRLDRA